MEIQDIISSFSNDITSLPKWTSFKQCPKINYHSHTMEGQASLLLESSG